MKTDVIRCDNTVVAVVPYDNHVMMVASSPEASFFVKFTKREQVECIVDLFSASAEKSFRTIPTVLKPNVVYVCKECVGTTCYVHSPICKAGLTAKFISERINNG